MFVIKNARLVSELSDNASFEFADVVVDGKFIKEVSPAGEKDFGEMESIEAKGMTLLPGFFDLHAHVMFKDQDYYASMARPQNTYVLDCMAYAQDYAKHGFTTIRDAGNDYYAGIAVRDAIDRGVIKGPRLYTAGKIISPVAKGNFSFGTLYWETDDPSEMRHIARTELAMGVDWIKYMVTGAVLNEGGEPGAAITSPEEIKAITDAAKECGLEVCAHCHGKRGILLAIQNGVKTIEHASYFDEECLEAALERKDTDPVATVPTLFIANTLVQEYFEGSILPEFVEKSKDALAHAIQGMLLCEENGVLVGFGTDIDRQMFDKYPGTEFIARATNGLDTVTVLKQATINSAKILGIDDITGSIECGKYADLVLVEGNPVEDIYVMKNLPKYVFKEGDLLAAN